MEGSSGLSSERNGAVSPRWSAMQYEHEGGTIDGYELFSLSFLLALAALLSFSAANV